MPICKDNDISKIKLSISSPCFNKKKLVFKLNDTDPTKIEIMFEEIKNVIQKHQSQSV